MFRSTFLCSGFHSYPKVTSELQKSKDHEYVAAITHKIKWSKNSEENEQVIKHFLQIK